MLINPSILSQDYDYNSVCEQAVAQMLTDISGLVCSDFGSGFRPEFDFMLGNIPVELKITNGVAIPVEVAKTINGDVKSGIAISIAPYILYLSNGHASGTGNPVGKLRMFNRKRLLIEAKKHPPKFYQGLTQSQSALVHYLPGPFFTNDEYIGDVGVCCDPETNVWSYDTSTFTPYRTAKGFLLSLHEMCTQDLKQP